jgi:acetyltransferase-like isoleucine patch superfamily enzyme
MGILTIIYKSTHYLLKRIIHIYDSTCTAIIFKGNNVLHKNYRTSGIPYIIVARGAKRFEIGNNFSMKNGIKGNPIGCYQKCTFFVDRGAELIIGDNVGISQAALIAHRKITIGNNVKIGGGVCIYDTDFHSLDPKIRKSEDDLKYRIEKEVVIGNNVFIGAKSLILKGVIIGENSIIGAGSVVTKTIPANEIWAGNPAKLIRKIQ